VLLGLVRQARVLCLKKNPSAPKTRSPGKHFQFFFSKNKSVDDTSSMQDVFKNITS
jgi:hypothetical protein